VIARWIATCGGLGYAPAVPGTVASLPVALLVWLLAPSLPWLAVAALGVAAVGVWAAGREEARLGLHDPRAIVVDEAAGMLVALAGHRSSLGWVLAVFVLFRVMDVWKPYPIHRLQSLPGGWGVVSDDLLAGLYANLLLQVPRWLAEQPPS
jgi:phosphatidylglycerophosphatase A